MAPQRFQDWLNRKNLPIKNIEKAGDTSVADTDVFMRQSRGSFKETITVRDVRRLLSGGWLLTDTINCFLASLNFSNGGVFVARFGVENVEPRKDRSAEPVLQRGITHFGITL